VNPDDKNNPFYMDDLNHYSKDIDQIKSFDEWKNKVTQYCETDCVSLYQILIEFRKVIANKWDLWIENYPTTPSLAFGLFKRHYLYLWTIPIYKGKVFEFLRASFTGGSTEMYRPYGKEINCYDANALYPSQMNVQRFPVGKTYQFVGNIELLFEIDNATWNKYKTYFIADAFVETTRDLYQPYLQINHLGKEDGLPENNRTIAPNGSFTMKINSCEYFNAIKRGDYKITINQGFLWKARAVFKKYTEDLHLLRKSFPKSDPMNFICKLMSNSIYGRFAMKPIISKTELISRDEDIGDFIEKNEIESHEDINHDYVLITYRPKDLFEWGILDIEYSNSIAISSAITAYSRVFMSQFKNNPKYNLYYMDTDSAWIDSEMKTNMIGIDLGQFKLENRFKEVVFLGPKMYSGITKDGNLITKVKGLKNISSLSFENIHSLLKENSHLDLNHVKWFRSINSIEMMEQPYLLQMTANKRHIIYKDGIAIDTVAFTLKNNKLVDQNIKNFN